MQRNYLRIGLRSQSKLEQSFYSFLYEKHFDWAIILGSFFVMLPYVGSASAWFLTIKVLLFSIVMYFCIRYIMTWKQLNGYYKVYKKAINVSKGLINRGNIKEVESDQIRKFNKEMTEAIESLVDQYVATKDPTITFQEFVQENPDSVKPFLDLLNRDIKLTHSVIGSSLSVLTVISHIRGIPRIEIANYHRFLYILMIMISFFIVYAIDISK